MNTRDDPTIARTNAAAFQAPALIPIGNAENVVLGVPWQGDEYLGFTPWTFEFQEDNDDGGAPSAQALPGGTRATTN